MAWKELFECITMNSGRGDHASLCKISRRWGEKSCRWVRMKDAGWRMNDGLFTLSALQQEMNSVDKSSWPQWEANEWIGMSGERKKRDTERERERGRIKLSWIELIVEGNKPSGENACEWAERRKRRGKKKRGRGRGRPKRREDQWGSGRSSWTSRLLILKEEWEMVHSLMWAKSILKTLLTFLIFLR